MVDFSPTVIFVLLLISVPLQYYLSPRNSSDIQYYLAEFIDDVADYIYIFKLRWLKIKGSFEDSSADSDDVVDESYGEKEGDGYFASKRSTPLLYYCLGSPEPRDIRPPWVQYRIGQVFRHAKHKYRGVIVGWDVEARAPELWLKQVLKNNEEWIRQPNYLVLIDTRDKHVPQIGYVIEENIKLVTGQNVMHDLASKYFEGFDGSTYRPRPWLRTLYPYG